MGKRWDASKRWFMRLDLAHTVVSYLSPLIPGGAIAAMAGLAQQQLWVVCLVFLAATAFFVAGRYYFTKHRDETTLRGRVHVTIGEIIDRNVVGERCDRRVRYDLTNTHSVALFVRQKVSLQVDGKSVGDVDYDDTRVLGSRITDSFGTDPVEDIRQGTKSYVLTVELRYGTDPDKLTMQHRFVATGRPDKLYNVNEASYLPI